MRFRINTNLSSLQSQRTLYGTSEELRNSYARLGSGQRLGTDDASGVGRASRLGAEARSLSSVVRNTQGGIDSSSRADAQLAEVSDNLSRLRELALYGTNGTLSDSDRVALNAEFEALVEEIDRTANEESGEQGISLAGGESFEVQTGTSAGDTISSPTVDVTAEGLNLDTVDLSSSSSAGAALDAVHSASDTVRAARGEISSFSRSLTQRQSSASRAQQGQIASASQITSLDIALESASLVSSKLLASSSIASLLQANIGPNQALQLLG